MIRVQNKALHFIHGRRIPPPIQQNFLSVPAQLVYNDLLFFKKCLAGVTDYDAMARITQGRVHRGDDPLHPRLQQPPARTDLGKNVFDFRAGCASTSGARERTECAGAAERLSDIVVAGSSASGAADGERTECAGVANGLADGVVGRAGAGRRRADVDELQEDLALIDIWCVNNGMQLNAKKCVAMDLSRARQPWLPQYMIGGAVLEYVSTQRLLGVHIARDLRWNHQVDVQRKKAAQTLGFAARNLRGCTQRVKRMAYLTLVKPKLFYGTPAWHPWTKTNTEKMARTQNKALHFIHGRHVPPPEKQNMLSVPAQLAYNDLLFIKKSLCGLTEYNAMARITEGRVHRGDDPLHPRLQQPPARTELGQNAFDYRIVAEWNAAPPAIKDCTAAQFPAVCKAYVSAIY
ncbi:Hypothetical predicted protein [Cloeon dipterum]|uniref:Reverse transcriptase domain-containing protein n=1 Tax=Cloeon dipterum TaxID=197152 RepID=A0A8S1DG22_9INSE|nr:Hypothetical predicted protein [Cloeon dipterum]